VEYEQQRQFQQQQQLEQQQQGVVVRELDGCMPLCGKYGYA
jgi:hypothetical protein